MRKTSPASSVLVDAKLATDSKTAEPDEPRANPFVKKTPLTMPPDGNANSALAAALVML